MCLHLETIEHLCVCVYVWVCVCMCVCHIMMTDLLLAQLVVEILH